MRAGGQARHGEDCCEGTAFTGRQELACKRMARCRDRSSSRETACCAAALLGLVLVVSSVSRRCIAVLNFCASFACSLQMRAPGESECSVLAMHEAAASIACMMGGVPCHKAPVQEGHALSLGKG